MSALYEPVCNCTICSTTRNKEHSQRKQQAISKLVIMRVQVFAKGAKFSMFKPAEEMVYIGLDEESRTKGKAAIDVVGAQSGKSAGSVLQQVTPRFPACTCCKHRLSASMPSGSLSLK